jgi:chorismate dehydratase
MSDKIKVSAVSYLNTAPFVYGLKHAEIKNSINLSLDYPSECARKVISGESDMGLVPLASIINKKEFKIITDYCIGAIERVRTVSLLSNSHIEDIDTIYLDYHSITSVTLIKVLAKHLWKKSIVWRPFGPMNSFDQFLPSQGIVAIGDKVFGLESKFKMNYDLANEWKALTGLPMVFAIWTTKQALDIPFLQRFNNALKYGLERIALSVDFHGNNIISNNDAVNYLNKNISFSLDEKKRESINVFSDLAKEYLIQ